MGKRTSMGVIEPTKRELEFEAAAKEYGSIKKAAEALGVSYSIAQQAIRRAKSRRKRAERYREIIAE